MPSLSTLVSSLLVPASAVLAGSFIRAEPLLARAPCKSTYISQNGDTCATMDKKFGLVPGTILGANPFLTCSDVWLNTSICVTDGPYSCSQTYISKPNDSCDSIESAFNLPHGSILQANTFLTCSDIWTNTPICIPNGASTSTSTSTSTTTSTPPATTPANGSCTSQTYVSQPGDNCDNIETKFALVKGDILKENSFVNCNDIWAGTPLVMCVPTDHGCTKTIQSWECATCEEIGATYGATAAQIQTWNAFVDCEDIWTGTPICVAH